jgi:hypothetical protein
VDHAGFLNGLTPGRGAAQAVHTNCKKQRCGLGCDIQNITNDGFFFNFNSHLNDLLSNSLAIITSMSRKNKREP